MNLPSDPKARSFGPYQILRKLGHGGMGEVYLAYDTICQRKIALKKIREELLSNASIKERFLREATLTAQLVHPSIIPIYSIHSTEKELYYIMPYLEGDTLKQILVETRLREKEGSTPHPIGSSIPVLSRLFLSICHAISYCHSKQILHRDLKPENILVGRFGQAVILDWGLAQRFGQHEIHFEGEMPADCLHDAALTRPGKIHGTLSHLAPERILGGPSTIQTDIYSLGVILYQILTLSPPFQRGRFREAKRLLSLEKLVDPIELAHHRAIPLQLAEIAKKALSRDIKERYQTVDEMIGDLENFIHGKPDWILKATLSPDMDEGWEFQENVLLSRMSRITRSTEMMEWVMLMISETPFTGNLKIETELFVEEETAPISFLLAIPQATERKGLEDGLRITIGTEKESGIQLTRQSVEVAYKPHVHLKKGKTHLITIEQVDQELCLKIDREPILEYTCSIPLTGSHFGFIRRAGSLKITPLRIYEGSHSAQIGCLILPDTYFASGDFKKAASEYLRIAESFKGRSEGASALFRLGITLIEQIKIEKTSHERQRLLSQAMHAFEELSPTQAAPLCWLGKSILYELEEECEDEIRCLEIALRKYPKHASLIDIEDRLFFRLYETSKSERILAYEFALLALRQSRELAKRPEALRIIDCLCDQLESLYFIEEDQPSDLHLAERRLDQATLCAFWLEKPLVLGELIDQSKMLFPQKTKRLLNQIFALIAGRHYPLAREKISMLMEEQSVITEENRHSFQLLQIAAMGDEHDLESSIEQWFELIKSKNLSFHESRVLLFLLERAIDEKKANAFSSHIEELNTFELAIEHVLPFASRLVELALIDGDHERASFLFQKWNLWEAPIDYLKMIYFLAIAEDDRALNISKDLLDCRFPPIHRLFSYYQAGKIDLRDSWIEEAFSFEHICLLRQLILYCQVTGKWGKGVIFERRLSKLFSRMVE